VEEEVYKEHKNMRVTWFSLILYVHVENS